MTYLHVYIDKLEMKQRVVKACLCLLCRQSPALLTSVTLRNLELFVGLHIIVNATVLTQETRNNMLTD